MTDEEKKEYEELKSLLYTGTISQYGKRKLIDMFEKQQKEIEELKTQIDEHVYYDLGGRSCGKTELLRHYKKGYDMNNKFWKDKIKAKIEEINKREQDLQNSINDKEREEYSDANISWELMDIHIRREVLQSLLDKEE